MSDQIIRYAAAAAAIGIFAYPFVLPAFSWLKAAIGKAGKQDPIREKMRDVETLLALSAKMNERGSKEGIDLCQKLIDVLLKQPK